MGMLLRRGRLVEPAPVKKEKEESTNDNRRKTRKARSADLPRSSE